MAAERAVLGPYRGPIAFADQTNRVILLGDTCDLEGSRDTRGLTKIFTVR